MPRKWFPHAKWPKILVGLHYYTMISFVLLLLTGVALYLPAVHTPLIPYLPVIYQVHILLGLVFGVTLFTPFLRKLLPTGRTVSRIDWLLPIAIGSAIVLTGVFLWGVKVFPTLWRAPSFFWHGWLSAVLGGWLLIHAFLKALGVRAPVNAWAGRVQPERRLFIRWFATGIAGTVLVTMVHPSQWLRGLVSPGTAAAPSAHHFAEYYTVVGRYPTVALTDYTLQVNGKVAHPALLKWTDLRQLQQQSETVNFQCVTGWSVANVVWDGVHIQALVNLVQPDKSVKYVNFYSFDGAYTESLKLSEALAATVLLATHLNGAPLPVKQGHPVRLVVPTMYGYKSIKWVNRVEFSDQPITGFWEQRGYPTEASF